MSVCASVHLYSLHIGVPGIVGLVFGFEVGSHVPTLGHVSDHRFRSNQPGYKLRVKLRPELE